MDRFIRPINDKIKKANDHSNYQNELRKCINFISDTNNNIYKYDFGMYYNQQPKKEKQDILNPKISLLHIRDLPDFRFEFDVKNFDCYNDLFAISIKDKCYVCSSNFKDVSQIFKSSYDIFSVFIGEDFIAFSDTGEHGVNTILKMHSHEGVVIGQNVNGKSEIRSIEYSKKKNLLLLNTTYNVQLHDYRIKNSMVKCFLKGEDNVILGSLFSGDENYVVNCAQNEIHSNIHNDYSNINVFDIRMMTKFRTIKHNYPVISLSWCDNEQSNYVAVCNTRKKTIFIYDLFSEKLEAEITTDHTLTGLKCLGDDMFIASFVNNPDHNHFDIFNLKKKKSVYSHNMVIGYDAQPNGDEQERDIYSLDIQNYDNKTYIHYATSNEELISLCATDIFPQKKTNKRKSILDIYPSELR